MNNVLSVSDKNRQGIEYSDYYQQMFPERCKDGISARTITFVVTTRCSLACTYCYEIHKGTQRMTFDVAKTAIDKILNKEDGFGEYTNAPAVILDFIGGEPFLEIELIDQIVDYFREQTILLNHPWADSFMISICSNGIAYNEPAVQKFLKKNEDVLSFSITIDGTKELHDSCRIFPDGSPSYDIAHAAAMDWMNKGHFLGSKITMAPTNIKYFSDCLKQMILDGYYKINANPIYEEGWTKEDGKTVYEQCKDFTDWCINNKKYPGIDFDISFFNEKHCRPLNENQNDNWCGGNASMLTIGPDGICYPCLRYMPMSLGNDQAPIIIGTVDRGIAKTEPEKSLIDDMSKITRRSQSTDECFYCPIAEGCSWCSAYNYQKTGSYNKRVTYICDIQKARALASVYFWNTYYKDQNIKKVKNMYIPKKWALNYISVEEYQKLSDLTLSLGGTINHQKRII